jgi:hypothetical protein
MKAGSPEKLRQSPGSALCQCHYIVVKGLLLIFFELFPEANSAELSNTIFYIIKGDLKQVKLLLPKIPAVFF